MIFSWDNKHEPNIDSKSKFTKIESVGVCTDGWRNKIYWGDNLQVMSHLLKEFRGQVQLVYVDPPFDSKAEYRKQIHLRSKTVRNDQSVFEEKQYSDIWTNDEYLQFIYERIILLRELLSDNGSIFLHCDYRKDSQLRLILDEVFGFQGIVNQIIWCYRQGGRSNNTFSQKHETVYWYSKTNEWIFNPDPVRIPYEGSGGYQTSGKGVRIGDKVYKPNELGKIPEDWWDIPAIPPMSKERVSYPTQKPEALLERIIKACSNPGDIVFDCFMGSGTTQAAAMKLGRRFIGCDNNIGAVHTTTKRLSKIIKDRKNIQIRLFDEVKMYDSYELFCNGEVNANKVTFDLVCENEYLLIKNTHSSHIEGKIRVDSYLSLVDCVSIDWLYDGILFNPDEFDIPSKKSLIKGKYKIPEYAKDICVKVVDLCGNYSFQPVFRLRPCISSVE